VFQRDKRDKKQTEIKMSYEDVEIEDMEWNEEMQAFTYPCPCGDLFQIIKVEASSPPPLVRELSIRDQSISHVFTITARFALFFFKEPLWN
jgi:hypothetical protein